MKNFILTLIVTVGLVFSASAQNAKGDWYVGTGDIANVAWTDWALSPTIGYFISDNFMVGLSLGMSSSSQKGLEDPGDPEMYYNHETSSSNLGPFVRYYVIKNLYANAGVTIGSSLEKNDWSYETWDKDYNKWNETSSSLFGFKIGIGYTLIWKDKICIEPSIDITTSSGSGTKTTLHPDQDWNNDGWVDAYSWKEVRPNSPRNTFNITTGIGIYLRLGN